MGQEDNGELGQNHEEERWSSGTEGTSANMRTLTRNRTHTHNYCPAHEGPLNVVPRARTSARAAAAMTVGVGVATT